MEGDADVPGGHWRDLERYLRPDPDDPGCDKVRDRLDVYAEMSVQDQRPALRHPEIARHLGACVACGQDLAGIVALLADEPGATGS